MNSLAKATYDNLKEKGELLEMFPTLYGNWEDDKEDFTEMFKLNIDIIES